MDEKLAKILKQSVHFVSSFVCYLFKVVLNCQLRTGILQKLMITNIRLISLKMPKTFCGLVLKSCQYF